MVEETFGSDFTDVGVKDYAAAQGFETPEAAVASHMKISTEHTAAGTKLETDRAYKRI